MLCPNCGEEVLYPQFHSASLNPRDLTDYQCERRKDDSRGPETLAHNFNGKWCLCPEHVSELSTAGNFSYSGQKIGGAGHYPKVEITVLQKPYCDRCAMKGEGY